MLLNNNSVVIQVVACSVDSHFTHLAWMNTPRSEGGLGRLDIPLLSDLTHAISKVSFLSEQYLVQITICFKVKKIFITLNNQIKSAHKSRNQVTADFIVLKNFSPHTFNPLPFRFIYYIIKYEQDYGVYLEDNGHTLRGLFIIDDKGTLRQITMNDLPVGRSVDETLRLVQAFQYTDKHGEVIYDVYLSLKITFDCEAQK